MRGLEGSTAIVTGGATLIGQAVVRAFHDGGASVADRRHRRRARAARSPASSAIACSSRQTDIRDDAQIAAFVAGDVERFGGIDFLVNLACSYVDEGAPRRGPTGSSR